MHRRHHRVRPPVILLAIAVLAAPGLLFPSATSASATETAIAAESESASVLPIQMAANGCLTSEPSTEALASTEAASIYRLYCAFFLRPPRADGLRYWIDVARSTPLSSIASTFAAGPEFQNRYGPLADTEFIELVFGNAMGRRSVADGQAYWSGRLEAGMSRGSMMLSFSDSTEFKRRTNSERPTADTGSSSDVYYANCSAVRQADAAPIRRGEPGYASHLDRDGDGIACEV